MDSSNVSNDALRARLTEKFGNKVLRLRFLRGPKMDYNWFAINVFFDDVDKIINNHGHLEATIFNSLKSRFKLYYETLVSLPSKIVITKVDKPLYHPLEFAVIIGDYSFLSSKLGESRLDLFNQKSNENKNERITIYLKRAYSRFFKASLSPTSTDIGNYIGDAIAHEMGHALGLVDQYNLFGRRLIDAVSIPTRKKRDEVNHNDPYYWEISDKCDLMDQFHPYSRPWNIRDINKLYLRLVLP